MRTKTTSARRAHRTGQSETINPDNIRMHRAIVAGVIVSLAAAVATSWSGLTFIAGWQLLPLELRWLTPVMIDVPLIVLTLSRGALAKRGVQARWILAFIIGLTMFSSFANIAHTIDGATAGLPVYVGASANGLAPWLILLLTEVLWLVITKQKPSAAFLKAQAEARAARSKPKRRTRSTRPATPVERASEPEPAAPAEPTLFDDDSDTLGVA